MHCSNVLVLVIGSKLEPSRPTEHTVVSLEEGRRTFCLSNTRRESWFISKLDDNDDSFAVKPEGRPQSYIRVSTSDFNSMTMTPNINPSNVDDHGSDYGHSKTLLSPRTYCPPLGAILIRGSDPSRTPPSPNSHLRLRDLRLRDSTPPLQPECCGRWVHRQFQRQRSMSNAHNMMHCMQ
jgi:hypothetical protein